MKALLNMLVFRWIITGLRKRKTALAGEEKFESGKR